MLFEPDLMSYGADLRNKSTSELQAELTKLADKILFEPAATAQRLAVLSQILIARIDT